LNSVEKFLTNQVRESWCTGVVAEVVGGWWLDLDSWRDVERFEVVAKYLMY